MANKRDYSWYVEPLDAHTNEWVGKYLWEESAGNSLVLCFDGIRRDLWRCDRDFVTKLKNSRHQLHFKFRIFVQEGRGPIRLSWIDKK